LITGSYKEHDYHNFLKQHAGLFLTSDDSYLVISKLKLGNEFETDFVVLRDNFSNGNHLEFIEIEKPQSKLFTKSGVPSKDFNTALQQIRDWRTFLKENKVWFRKYLPTRNTRILSNSSVSFKIIIGTSTRLDLDNFKRNEIANELNVEVRSFDYLTDRLKRRVFHNYAWLEHYRTSEQGNLLANPFHQAISDSQWRKFCQNRVSYSHFYSRHVDEVLNMREYSDLFDQFKKKYG
ncbi:MAG: DUF4263 domain-containing protein, partial [Cyclobacteriaceae bacterium]